MFLSYIGTVISPLLCLLLFKKFIDVKIFFWFHHLIFTVGIPVKGLLLIISKCMLDFSGIIWVSCSGLYTRYLYIYSLYCSSWKKSS